MNASPAYARSHPAATARRAHAARHVACGQAIVEFLAAAGTLAALAIGVVVLGRLQDLQWTVVQSSRYAAFEQIADDAPLASHVVEQLRPRFYSGVAGALRADDREPDPDRWTDSNPHWVDWARARNPLVARPADVTFDVTDAAPPGGAARALTDVAATFDQAAALAGRRFDVDRRGYHTATVRVRVAPLAPMPPFDALRLELVERTALFTDGWSARGPAHTAERTAALVPTTALVALRPVLDPLRSALALLEPAFRQLCLGQVDPEPVPADRLGRVGSAPRGSWAAPC